MNDAIQVINLVKCYGSTTVLKKVSFSVKHNEIFAILGANGAGKTTTLECIEGLRAYDQGEIHVSGRFGVQLQSSSLIPHMKVQEALALFAKWQHAEINPEYLVRVSVESLMDKQYAQLSTGQKRRLHLALAMLGDPDIIFLDEPTAGLDITGRASMHAEIKALKKRGKTIILASHDMSEVEELCDRIAVLKNGEIAFLGTAEQMTETKQSLQLLMVRFSSQLQLDDNLIAKKVKQEKEYYLFPTADLEATIADILLLCKIQNITLLDIKVTHAGLEQRFLELIKEEA